jgi:hypothetical protein
VQPAADADKHVDVLTTAWMMRRPGAGDTIDCRTLSRMTRADSLSSRRMYGSDR